jgi:hypothetical protein
VITQKSANTYSYPAETFPSRFHDQDPKPKWDALGLRVSTVSAYAHRVFGKRRCGPDGSDRL